jgi:hypothetical protein
MLDSDVLVSDPSQLIELLTKSFVVNRWASSTPTSRSLSALARCARPSNGNVAKRRAMNSRRLIWSSQTEDNNPITFSKRERCALQPNFADWQLWVRLGHSAMSAAVTALPESGHD